MSVNCAIYLFFPIEQATRALRAIRTLMVAPPGKPDEEFVAVVAPDGEVTRFPAIDEIPAGPQPLQAEEPIEFTALLNAGEGGAGVYDPATFPAEVSLEPEERYLQVRFLASGRGADLLIDPPFPDRVLAVAAEAGGVAVADVEEWRWLVAPFDAFDPGEHAEVGIDGFADYLFEHQGRDAED